MQRTKILLNIPVDYKLELEKIAAMETIETGTSYNLTKLIIETLEREYNLKEYSNE